MHVKIAQNMYIFTREFHTFPVREGTKFSTIFSVYDPSKKAHPHHKIRAFLDAERHEFWERQDSSALWAREMPKISPKNARILATP